VQPWTGCCCSVVDGLLYAGHDISDGGLITCLLEMAFAGNCSVEAEFNTDDAGLRQHSYSVLFNSVEFFHLDLYYN